MKFSSMIAILKIVICCYLAAQESNMKCSLSLSTKLVLYFIRMG